MLVIGRHKDESIIIDGNIEVKICDIQKSDKLIRLGITAPRSISVHRKEIQEAINRERRSCGVGAKGITAVGLQS